MSARSRRAVLRATVAADPLAAARLAALAATTAHACPGRPIRSGAPSTAGGATDNVARIAAQPIGEKAEATVAGRVEWAQSANIAPE